MFFGAYLGTIGVVFLAGLLWLVTRAGNTLSVGDLRARLRRYVVLSALLGALALAVFVAGSAGAGLMRFGAAATWRFPGDYLAAGPLGWLLAVVALLGALSPLVALAWAWRVPAGRMAGPRAG